MGPLEGMAGLSPEERRRRMQMMISNPAGAGIDPGSAAAMKMFGPNALAGLAQPGAGPAGPPPGPARGAPGYNQAMMGQMMGPPGSMPTPTPVGGPPPGPGGMGAAMGAMQGGMPPGPPRQFQPPPGPQPQMMGPPPDLPPQAFGAQAPQHGVASGPVPIPDAIRQQYQNQMKQQLAGAQTPANVGGIGSAGLAGLGMGAATGSPIAAGVGAGVGALGQFMKDRRRKVPTAGAFAQGGVVDVQRLAAGGAAKERKGFPQTAPAPKKGKRGMGAATRGWGKAQG